MRNDQSTFTKKYGYLIDKFDELEDMRWSDLQHLDEYRELKMKKNDGLPIDQNRLDELESVFKNKIVTSSRWNKFQNALISMQTFIKNEVEGFVLDKQQEMKTYTDTKQQEINQSQQEMNNYADTKKQEVLNYTDTKKSEVNTTVTDSETKINATKDDALTSIEKKKENIINYMDETTAGALRNDIGVMGESNIDGRSLIDKTNNLQNNIAELEQEIDAPETITKSTTDNIITLPSSGKGQVNVGLAGNTEVDENGNVKSTVCAGRLKATGKNLFDEKSVIYGKLVGSNNGKLYDNKEFGASDYIPVLPNTKYTQNTAFKADQMVFYDRNMNYIGTNSNETFITTENCFYVRLSVYLSEIKNAFFYKGTDLEYEPYKDSKTYILCTDENGKIMEANSLPNGTKDEVCYENGKYVLKKRTGKKENVASGTVINYADMATEGQFEAWGASGEHIIGVKGDTLGFIATTLIYQLETPKVYDIFTTPLIGYPNGTVIKESIIPDCNYYKDKFNIEYTEYPIESVDKLSIIDIDTGQKTPLDANLCIIAEDGLSFTHQGIENGDWVDCDLAPLEKGTNGEMSITVPTNLRGVVQNNTEGIRQLGETAKNLDSRVKANKNSINIQMAELTSQGIIIKVKVQETAINNDDGEPNGTLLIYTGA